jgi:hypothetical protein
MPARNLPVRPDLQQLKRQAKQLLSEIRTNDSAAVADARQYHPDLIDPAGAKLADAQLVLARSYGASSWPRLVAACELIDAIWRDDLDRMREILQARPEIARDYAAAPDIGWRPAMTEAANHGLRRVVARLQEHGARGVAAAMARPELHPWLDTLRALGRLGARPARDAVGGAVEILQGPDFALMVEIGLDIHRDVDWRRLLALALETYTRSPAGKHRILETMAESGVPLPDTPPMAVHRGRLDLLERHLRRDASLLQRTFTHEQIFPPELGCHDDHSLALVGVPLEGATLLHVATEYEELDVARWLLDAGVDPNARARVGADGFGGHTALFQCVVGYNAGRTDDPLARLLLDRGADPNARGSIRMRLPFARDKAVYEYRDVTPLGWGRRFHDQTYVCQAAMQIIAERGGSAEP